ncbi:MAG: polysaccharide biosynthesis/export family protein [Pseudomonadota bacterium]
MIRVMIGVRFCAVLLFLVSLNGNVSANESRSHTLAPGDVISVDVKNEPELKVSRVQIPENGTVSLPLIGRVELMRKTPQQAQAMITERYFKDYLKQPSVELSVDQFRPFYIDGKVNAPGSFNFSEGLTVSSAIEQAGGFANDADRAAITLLFETSLTGPVPAGLDDTVMPGDVITVN